MNGVSTNEVVQMKLVNPKIPIWVGTFFVATFFVEVIHWVLLVFTVYVGLTLEECDPIPQIVSHIQSNSRGVGIHSLSM